MPIRCRFCFSVTSGIAINDNGQFVGVQTPGVNGYYSSGASLSPLVGFLPTDINNDRLITGSVAHVAAVLDFDTNMTTLLGKLSLTDAYSRALGLNGEGTVVGIPEGTRAFIYDTSMGFLGNLTSMLSNDYVGWTILVAEDISNAGQIIGVDHAVVLTAVPEPSALFLVTSLLLSLGGVTRFRVA